MPHLFRFRLAAVLVAVFAGACSAGPQRAAPASTAAPFRPNILWITVEDMSPRLGAYGDALARTPHIDRLAREGTRFTRAFSVSGVCAPSRSALITGAYPIAIGTLHMRTIDQGYLAVPPPEVRAFTEPLRAAGYYTSNNVKTDYQFADVRDPRQPLTAWDASSPDAHWRARAPGQPFFAVFNSTRTHESRVWPDATEPRTTPADAVVVPPYYPDIPAVREDLARHYDNIARMDAWVGERLAELEADGLADSTIVVFFSDHGDGLPRAKRWTYDSGLHVPLIVRWPEALRPADRPRGGTEDRLVSFVDFGPTMLSLAGVPVPGWMHGVPFLGPAEGPPRRYVYAARDRHDEAPDRVRAVRDARFKYLRNYHPELPYVQPIAYRDRMPMMQAMLALDAADALEGPSALWFRDARPTEELYDLEADPHEIRNRAGDPAHAATLARMRGALDAFLADVGDLGAVPEAEMKEQMWPGGVQPVTARPEAMAEGGRVRLTSATPGASIAYTLAPGDAPPWRLYTAPVAVPPGATLRARAVRYGYAESDELRHTPGS